MIMPSQKGNTAQIGVFRANLQFGPVTASFVGDLSVQVKDFSGGRTDAREVVYG